MAKQKPKVQAVRGSKRLSARWSGKGKPVSAGEHKEQQWCEADRRLATTLANLADGFAVFDREWRYIFVNEAASRILKKRPEELLGRVVWEVFPQPVALPVFEYFHRAVQQNVPVQFEQYYPGAGWFEHRCQPTREGLALYFSDITERKQAEEALRRAKEKAGRASQSGGRGDADSTLRSQETLAELEHVSYCIVDHLRGPLRSVMCFAQLTLADPHNRLSEESKDFLPRIIASAQRMDHLLKDSLSYSRAVRHALVLAPVAMGTLLRNLLANWPQFQAPQVEIRVEQEFPPVQANEVALGQCFFHLLENAVKFVAPQARPRVRVWAEQRELQVRLWVEDNGLGIPAERHPSLFTPFRRRQGAEPDGGLGLVLVRRLTERMGGKVGLESALGKGSRFWIELPAASPGL